VNVLMSAVLKYRRGFTLVELLVALALLGVVLSAVVYVNIGTIRSSASLQSRNELLSEMQIAQNYMASKLKQAAYVFPPSANFLALSATGDTSRNVATGNSQWQVGTHPITAFILPPKVVVPGACAAPTAALPTSDTCYTFYAFYAMPRSTYVTATVATGANNPGADAGNAASWVLVEYRRQYDSPGFLVGTTLIPNGGVGRLLMDYLDPVVGSNMFTIVAPVSGGASAQTVGTVTVTMNLASRKSVAGQVVSVPPSVTTVYPRNVGKPDLNN
jgi:prepilin-type N-terminal cleavage/methylation domain-containing protein